MTPFMVLVLAGFAIFVVTLAGVASWSNAKAQLPAAARREERPGRKRSGNDQDRERATARPV